jgi:hypothetical protein
LHSEITFTSIPQKFRAGVSGEKHRPIASHWQTLSHNVVSNAPRNG